MRWAEVSAREEDKSGSSSEEDGEGSDLDGEGSDLDGFIVADDASESDEGESEGGAQDEINYRESEGENDHVHPAVLRPAPLLDDDDLELVLENSGLQDPYENGSRLRKRKKGANRSASGYRRSKTKVTQKSRKKILSSSSGSETELVEGNIVPQTFTNSRISELPSGRENLQPNSPTSNGDFLQCDSFYTNQEMEWVIDEKDDDWQQGSWSQRATLAPSKPKVLASIFQRRTSVNHQNGALSATQMHRRQDGTVYYARPDGSVEERGYMTQGCL